MNRRLSPSGLILCCLLSVPAAWAGDETVGSLGRDAEDVRHFMFIGEPDAAAWQFLIDNPEDRKAAVAGAFRALGGDLVSYYFGLGDGKNYITVTLPNDNELIQAVYLMRLPSGMLASYRVIELMPLLDGVSELLKTYSV